MTKCDSPDRLRALIRGTLTDIEGLLAQCSKDVGILRTAADPSGVVHPELSIDRAWWLKNNAATVVTKMKEMLGDVEQLADTDLKERCWPERYESEYRAKNRPTREANDAG